MTKPGVRGAGQWTHITGEKGQRVTGQTTPTPTATVMPRSHTTAPVSAAEAVQSDLGNSLYFYLSQSSFP